MADDHSPHRDHPAAPIRSAFGDDPEMKELVEYFVSELRERMAALEDAVGRADRAEVKRLTHQLKGAAGGYGFEEIGDAAARAEEAALADEADLSALAEEVESLIHLCRRACDSHTSAGG